MGELLVNQNREQPNQHRIPNVSDQRNPFAKEIDDKDDYGDGYYDVPRSHHRQYGEDDDRRRWEVGMRTEIPEFHGTLQLEEFLNWLAMVEEVLVFKGVPENQRVPLMVTRFRDRVMAWWQQNKQTQVRLGKSKIMT